LFNPKVATSTHSVTVQTLPPTEAAAMYHSMRVYYQVQVWKGRKDMNPLHWGWRIHQGTCVPLVTHLPPAPKELLEVIMCKCKTGCSTLKCSCKKHGLHCTIGCGECHGLCSNSTPSEEDLYDQGELDGELG